MSGNKERTGDGGGLSALSDSEEGSDSKRGVDSDDPIGTRSGRARACATPERGRELTATDNES